MMVNSSIVLQRMEPAERLSLCTSSSTISKSVFSARESLIRITLDSEYSTTFQVPFGAVAYPKHNQPLCYIWSPTYEYVEEGSGDLLDGFSGLLDGSGELPEENSGQGSGVDLITNV